MNAALALIVFALVFLGLILLVANVRLVQQFEKGVVLRFGRP